MQSKPDLNRILATLVILLLAACGPAETREAQDPATGLTRPASAATAADAEAAHSLSATFRAAAQRALPAVVFVQVEREAQAAQRGAPGAPVNPFDFFFGPQGPQGPQGELPPQQGSGSGFIIDEEGHVITPRGGRLPSWCGSRTAGSTGPRWWAPTRRATWRS